MNRLKHHLLSNLKALYNNNDLSDGTMDIIEVKNLIFINSSRPVVEEFEISKKKLNNVEESDQKGNTLNEEEESDISCQKLFCSLPIHCLILSCQSDYFKNLMYNSNMMESKTKVFNMNVGEGEGLYMQYLIQSFYDTDIFNEMDCNSLVCVLELADRYSCDAIIDQISSLVIKFSDIEDCEKVAQQINNAKYGLEKTIETSKKFLNECEVFATKYFCPLEIQSVENHKLFQQLSFDLLIAMLRCKQPIAWHENSVLYYIELWLKFDKARQTEDNIKSLLKATNYFGIEGDFLIEVITKDHYIFNKWSNYKDWFIHAVGHHCFSRKQPYLSIFNYEFSRNFEIGSSENSTYSFLMKRQVHDEINSNQQPKNSNLFGACKNVFVYKGYQLLPLICFENNSFPYHKTCSVSLGFNQSSLCSQSTESLDYQFLSLQIQGCISTKHYNVIKFNKYFSFENFKRMNSIGRIDKGFADSLNEYCLDITVR